MTNDAQTSLKSSRMRLVAYICAIIAVALILLVVTTSFVQRQATQNRIQASLDQEVSELTRFAQNGIDPDTGESFSTPERFLEVYLQRQVTEPSELIVGGVTNEGLVKEQVGNDATSFESLSAQVQNAIKAPGSSGTITDPQFGTISWRAISINTTDGQGVFSVASFHDNADKQLNDQILWMVLLALLALVATALVAWQLSGRLISHVGKFEQEVDRAISGAGVRPLPTTGGQEYSQLASAANRLIEFSEDELSRERQFSDDLSYALRTPLALIEANLDEARDNTAVREENLSLVTDELARLRHVVADVSELGTLERQRFLMPDEDVDVARFIVSYVTDRLEADPNEHITMEDSPTGLLASFDKGALRRALDEIVANAFDASEAESWVSLSVEPVNDPTIRWARITVMDEGRGVPKDEQAHVLERFAVASNDPQPGSGLGLSVARALVTGIYGRLKLRSHESGTKVSIDIPRVDDVTLDG